MKTFNEVTNQPTTKDGSLKAGLAITKLANANLDVTLSGTVVVQGQDLELAAIVGAALIPAFDAKFDIELNDLLSLYSEGYISPIQRQIATAGTVAAKLPHGSVLSAHDYMKGNVRAVKLDNLAIYYSLNRLLASDKATKADFVEFATELRNQLFGGELLAVYAEKVKKEAELAAQFDSLTSIGFTDIQPLKDSTFSAQLALANADSLSQLSTLGYVLKDSSVDISTATIKVVFNSQPADKIA